MTRKQALEWAKLVEGQPARVAEDKLIKGVARALIEAEADLVIAKEALQLTIKAVNDGYLAAWPEKIVIEQALSELNKRGGE